MQNYKLLNNIIGWIVGIAACTVYVLTAEPTASWWDCGEYISTAYKLQVGHPPGAPTFQLLGCVFASFAGNNVIQIGWLVNVMSALCSGFSILFLFWSITMLGKKIIVKHGEMTVAKMWTIFGAGIVGSMAYTFSDSFWFSAVEGEVYAMSSFFTAITFWAILKWDEVADQPHHLRWIIFISFMIGLAIGVHLLNLLVIPAVVFVIYYRKYTPTRKRFWKALGISFVLLAVILWGIIPWIVNLAGKIELFAVNSLNLPFNTGTIIYFVVLIGGLIWGIKYAVKHKKIILHTGLLCLTFLLIGYSTFLILVIRANAGVPINENEPKNALTLLSYLNREQYGSRPLVFGEWFNAQPIGIKEGKPIYNRTETSTNYVQVGTSGGEYKFHDKDMTLFPRMGARETSGRNYAAYYRMWSGCKGDRAPSMGENLRFFFRYQVGWEYMRYFMWNFVGRQNNVQGLGYDLEGNRDLLNGNWLSGINFIDEARLGPQTNLPEYIENNQGRNKYYFLPLILGIIGLLYQYKKDKQNSFVVFLLFFMTGLAIIIYLNQPSMEPRERDYSVVGSFYAFAIWIGLGVMSIAEVLSKKINAKAAAVVASVGCFTAVPLLMGCQNWDDHDRSSKCMARDAAKNTLESCDKNGILIANGDNDTFPVWYCQEVEGVRTDVRIINSALAGSYWHIQPLFNKIYDAAPVPFTLRKEQYGQGKNDNVYLDNKDFGEYKELSQLMKFVASENPASKLNDGRGADMSVIPTRKVKITIDTADLIKKGIITKKQAANTPAVIEWVISPDYNNYIGRSSLAFIDILASSNWERPIYLASPYAQRNVFPTPQYAEMNGCVHKLVPYVNPNKDALYRNENGINTEKTYDLFMNKFQWGNLNDPKALIDPESMQAARVTRQQYAFLAQALLFEGKVDKATKVLEKALYFFPDEKIYFDSDMLFFAEIYFKAGNKEEGQKLSSRLINIYEKRINYFESFPSRFSKNVRKELQESVSMLYALKKQVLEVYGENELAARIDGILAGRV